MSPSLSHEAEQLYLEITKEEEKNEDLSAARLDTLQSVKEIVQAN